MAEPASIPQLDHVIRDAAELTARIVEWHKAGYHVLSPASTITTFGESYGVLVSTVLINPDPAGGEVYFDRNVMQGDELALSRIGLQRIEQLAGLSWIPGASRRTDNRLIPNLWEYESWAAYLSFDGTPRTVKGTAEVDLRDGSAQIGEWTREAWDALMTTNRGLIERGRASQDLDWNINGWSDKRLMQARRFGLRLAETKSQSACVRNALGIRQKFTRKELLKPFVVLKVTYLPDASDTEIRAILAMNGMNGAAGAALYGGHMSAASPFARRALPDARDSSMAPVIDIVPAERTPDPVPVRTEPPAAPISPAASQAPKTAAGEDRPRRDGDPGGPPSTSAPHQPVSHDGGKTPAVVDELQRRGVRPAAPVPPPAKAPAPPAAAKPLPRNACHIVNFHEDDPKPKRNGDGTYIKAHIETSDGRQLTCVYGKFRDRLREAHRTGALLVVHDKKSEYGNGREVDKIDDFGAPQDVALPIGDEDFKL